jgi:peptidoglycan hydrolase CwlO-like protein
MKLLFIMLSQSVTGAVIEIILLLLVAVLIGFLTAFYYQKSVYTPIVKGLEAEKEDLNKRIVGLNNDINKLNGKIEELGNVIVEKDKEIELLKKPKK